MAASSWTCTSCTFAGNDACALACIVCGEVKIEAGEYTCPICTLLNPATAGCCSACGDKLKKEILAAETRVKKAEGGSMNDRSSAVDKAILKGVASGVYDMSDFRKYKKTGEIPGSKKRTEKALGGMLGFKKKDKKKEKEKKDSEKGTKPKDLIYKPKKMSDPQKPAEDEEPKDNGKYIIFYSIDLIERLQYERNVDD